MANTTATEEVIEQSAQDMPILLDNSESSDVPSFDALTTQPAIEENAGDLPAIDEPAASDGEG
jgi:hypothetical protein